ncbi:unnamed protein product [Lampetra fluviatilis]
MLVLSEATGSQRAALSSKSAVAASCETADGRTRSKRTFDNGDGGDDIKIVERLNVALGGHVLVRLASAQMCFALRPTGAAVVNAQRRVAALDSLVALSTRPPWSAHRTRCPRDAEQRRSVPCKGFVRMCHAAPMRLTSSFLSFACPARLGAFSETKQEAIKMVTGRHLKLTLSAE